MIDKNIEVFSSDKGIKSHLPKWQLYPNVPFTSKYVGVNIAIAHIQTDAMRIFLYLLFCCITD